MVIASPARRGERRVGRFVGLGVGAAGYLVVTGVTGYALLRVAASTLHHPPGAALLAERFALVVVTAWLAYALLALALPRLVARVGGAAHTDADRLSGRLLLALAGTFIAAAVAVTVAALRY